MRRRGPVLALGLVGFLHALVPGQAQTMPVLAGRAVLPAATFAEGPTSGAFIGASPINGQSVPFTNRQPVQGFSATLDNGDGTFLVMSDNGYGSLENSADFNLRVHRIKPEFKTRTGGSGTIAVLGFIELSDPDRKVPFTITHQFTTNRVLTGADFDIESMQRAPDGTLWFGDEFGPFLLHADANGRLLDAPIALPDLDNPGKEIRSPQNPFSEEASAVRIMNAVRDHARSKGNLRPPVFSPWHVMFEDGNTNSFIDNRLAPPPGSGLVPASSEVFNVASLKSAGYPVVAWTVNDKPRMTELMRLKVDGIISDRPDLLLEAVREFDANGDGIAGDFLDADGLIDPAKFDAQGHRGGRDLRPENTIPAMEVALDNFMTTLEFDSGVTKDGVPLVSHDPHVQAQKARRTDGQPYTLATEVLIKDLTVAEIQSRFVNDKLFRGPAQKNDPALSPASVAFFGNDASKIYVLPTVQQVFDFAKFYAEFHRTGAGKSHPQAALRARNADRVRFNVETKVNPRLDTDEHGEVFARRTIAPEPFARALAGVIVTNHLETRADIQSFDFRTLLVVQAEFPAIRTVYLFGDFPKFADPSIDGSDDGTNLQDEQGRNTAWLAGMYWPYRSTKLSNPFRSQRSGGFEGMAISADKTKLLPLLEKPLVPGEAGILLIHEFDLASKKYSANRFKYPLDPRGTSIGDFQMFDAARGLVIERDDSQGDLNGFKAVYDITLAGASRPVHKELAADLLRLDDRDLLSSGGGADDVGLGFDFAFPFTTIENVVFFGLNRIGLINDNNYPFSIGRHLGTGSPDDNEFILLDLPRPLGNYVEVAPASTVKPYYVDSPDATAADILAESKSLVTVADPGIPNVGGYRMVGIPDGLGALDNADDTFTVFMNHELRGGDLPGGLGTVLATTNALTGAITRTTNSAVGIARAFGGKGAFVSEWTFRKSDFSVVRAGDLIQKLMVWDAGNYRAFNPAADFHPSRFCSADLPPASAFYNEATGKGTRTRLFMNGEEDGGLGRPGQGGRAFAHLVTGPEKGTSYELPYLGRFAWENAVACPVPQDLTILMGLDDSDLTNSQVYVYLGNKSSSGLDIEKAGLQGGKTYVVRVEDAGTQLKLESNERVLGTSTNRVLSAAFKLHEIGDASKLSDVDLDLAGLENGTSFFRVEDGAWDPTHPSDFYFVTTGRVESNGSRSNYHSVTHATRLWRLRFADIRNPQAGGTIEMVLEGPAGTNNGLSDTQPVMMDNLTVTKSGRILLQEDPGNYARLARTWMFDPANGRLVTVSKANARRFDAGGAEFLTQDEEASGILDVSDILGEGWVLYDVQAHYRISGELAEGGQLVATRLTDLGQSGPGTTRAPYYVASPAAARGGWEVALRALVTVGDTNAVLPNGYKMVGIPDGLGAFDNHDGTFTVLMNHELRGGDLKGGTGTVTFSTNATTGVITTNSNAAQGIARSHGAKGAFVSEWTFRKSDLSVIRAGDLMKPDGFMVSDGSGGYRPFNATNDFHLSRLCSADLPAPTALFNALTGKGTTNRLFLNGEEDGGAFRSGQGGRALAHVASGPDKGRTYELPYLGKFAWENVVANPAPQDLTVVMGLDDSDLTNSQVYVYLGEKRSSGLDIQKAGLVGGRLHGVRIIDNGSYVPFETNDKVLGATTRAEAARFELYDFGDASRITESNLDRASATLVTSFQRVEDGTWDPRRPNEFYFLTTGRVESGATRTNYHEVTHATRLWRLSFDDITHPELGGFVELVLDGAAGPGKGLSDAQPVMMDNLTFTRDGHILIQEDPGNYERLAKIWSFEPVSRALVEIAAADPRLFGGAGTSFLTRDEEASGIIDVSDILGEGWVLFDVQAHYRISGELVEGGQLVAMQLHPIPAFPSIRVGPQSQRVEVDNTVTLAVDAVGTGPFSYRWFWNGQVIPGATAAAVTLYGLDLNQAGDLVTVEVTGAEGKVLSSPATIKVGPAAPGIELKMYPGVMIRGLVGATYRIEYLDAIGTNNVWQTLTNLVLPGTPYLHIDTTGGNRSQRNYRVVAP